MQTIFFLKLLPFRILLWLIELRDRPNRVLQGSGKPISAPSGKWKSLAPLPSWRYESAACNLNDIIYVIGGVRLPSVWFPTRLAEAYSPKTNKWKKIQPYPKLVHHARAAACGNRLYVVGGNGIRIIPRSDVYAYDPNADSWIKCANMPTARGGALGVVSLGGKIFAVGGGVNKISVDTLEVYDPKTDRWETRSPMPTAREHVAAVAVDGRIHVLGGYTGSRFNILTTHEVYDSKTDKWEKRAPVPYPVCGMVAEVIGKRIFMFGGEQGWAVSAEVHEYIIDKDIWIRRKDLPVARYAHSATTLGSGIHVIGGNSKVMGNDFLSEHDLFLP